MKLLISLICACAFSISAFAASATVEGAKKDYADFKQEMSVKLDAAEKKIETMKADARAKSNASKEKAAVDLQDTRAQLANQLESAKTTTKEDWRSFKKHFAKSVGELNSKVQKGLKD